jgi:hypothetical protein
MEPININRIERGCDVRQSNYALIGKPVGLNCRVLQVSRPVEIDRWEDEGGYPAPDWTEKFSWDEEERYRSAMRVRGSRKQRAAKAYIPRESINVIKVTKAAPVKVAMAKLDVRAEMERIEVLAIGNRLKERMREEVRRAGADKVKVAELEARIAEIMDVINAPKIAEAKRRADLRLLEHVFDVKYRVNKVAR